MPRPTAGSFRPRRGCQAWATPRDGIQMPASVCGTSDRLPERLGDNAASRHEQRARLSIQSPWLYALTMTEAPGRWRLRAGRLVFAIPVAAVVVWWMAVGARQDTVWESRQRLLGTLALVCLPAASVAPAHRYWPEHRRCRDRPLVDARGRRTRAELAATKPSSIQRRTRGDKRGCVPGANGLPL